VSAFRLRAHHDVLAFRWTAVALAKAVRRTFRGPAEQAYDLSRPLP